MHFQVLTTLLAAFAVGHVLAGPIAAPLPDIDSPNDDAIALQARDAELSEIEKIHQRAAEAHNAVILKAREEAAAAGHAWGVYPAYPQGAVSNFAVAGTSAEHSTETTKLLGLIPLLTTDKDTVKAAQAQGFQVTQYWKNKRAVAYEA
ncbi:hypothetical protein Slin15195_G128080 [Septoria linicola]|uniref:Uncharacterized protein n=1 Tax=Septoria linicola TaxID=215465 RepID=A0A9Q9ER40_9PEZI|nr:hypothetical protein Slin15195_G128080 [Septoria linicola]